MDMSVITFTIKIAQVIVFGAAIYISLVWIIGVINMFAILKTYQINNMDEENQKVTITKIKSESPFGIHFLTIIWTAFFWLMQYPN